MELNSFKSLLIKKAEGNADLQSLIKLISDDFLAEEIIESLEKMAASKGDKANSAMTSFAGSITTPDVNMLHDAISHHLSHAAAINKEHPPTMSPVEHSINVTDHRDDGVQKPRQFNTTKVDMHPAAAKHMETAMGLTDMAARASKHSFGKMDFDHVPTHAWEMNYTSDHTRANRNGQIKFADDQQGLKRRLDGKRFPNHGYLMLNPHGSYKNKGKLRGHEGQYPFEEMKMNDKHIVINPDHYVAKDEAGKVPTTFTPHPFDSHPLLQKEGKDKAWERPEDSRSDADRTAFAQNLDKWQESPAFNSWLDKQDTLEQKDKAKFDSHGSQRSVPMLEGVKRLQPAQSTEAKKPEVAQSSEAVSKPDIITRKAPQSATPKAEHPRANEIRASAATQPPKVQAMLENYIKGNPETKDLIDSLPDHMKKQWGII